jgi:hypothetical protein
MILSSSVPQPDHDAPPPSTQQEPARLPIAFSLPELPAEPGSPEEGIIHQAQQDFADEMAAAPDADPASPAYAEHWKRAASAHDEYLRRTLGWDKFNQLSAIASQRTHAGSASPQ